MSTDVDGKSRAAVAAVASLAQAIAARVAPGADAIAVA